MRSLSTLLPLALLCVSCQEWAEKQARIQNPMILYPAEQEHSLVGSTEGRSRTVSKGTEGTLTFGPYTDALHDGVNMVSFQLEVSEKTSEPVARIQVTQNTALLASKVLRGTDFHRAGEAQEFRLRFKNEGYDNIEFVVNSLGGADLKHNRTVVRPIPQENVHTWTAMYIWDLVATHLNGENVFSKMTEIGIGTLLDYTLELPELPHSTLDLLRQRKKEQGADGVRFILNISISDLFQPCCVHPQRDPRSISEQEIMDFYRDRSARFGEDKLRDVAAIYLVDEPELAGQSRGYQGFHPWQVDAAVRAANLYFPAIPTFVAYFRDYSHAAKGLDYRGMEYYHIEADNPGHRQGRYHEVRSTLNGAKIVVIPRAFAGGDQNFRYLNDAQQAKMTKEVMDDIGMRDDVVGSIWYGWGNNRGDTAQFGLESMPQTQAEIKDWSTRRRFGLPRGI